MKRWCVVAGLALLAGCTSSEATPTSSTSSAAIAAPTTPPPTEVTATPTAATNPATAPSTTAIPPTTTTASTAAEQASVEIEATLNAFNTEIYDCYAAPEACDVDSVLDTYYVPGDNITRPVFKDVWVKRIENNQIKISEGLIDRTIVWISTNEDGTVGTSFHCEVDRTFNVPKDTPPDASTTFPPDRTPSYIRFYYEWERQPDGTWKIAHSESSGGRAPKANDVGELPSLTESEIEQCD